MTEPREIPFGRPWITEDERRAVLEVLDGHILTHGPRCQAFEDAFADFMGGEAHCVSVSSCMAALHLSYLEAGIGEGDEVLVPAQTHIATVHAVELVGARPVFVDCELQTGNMDPDRIEERITDRTRAIGLVHFLGIPCDMDRIGATADAHGLRVVEDAALAVGTRYRGAHAGTIGDSGCFSFYPVKHITTGEGGMFVSRDPEIAERVARIRGFGVDRTHGERRIPGHYDVDRLGLNYRMSELQASLGVEQVKKLDAILRRRSENFDRLRDRVVDLPGLSVLESPESHRESSHYCLTVLLDPELRARRNELVAFLNDRGVGTSIYYPQPTPRMSYYRDRYGYDESEYPSAAAISDGSIALPVGPHLTTDDMDYIAGILSDSLQDTVL